MEHSGSLLSIPSRCLLLPQHDLST
jgi:hypothetical protein